VCYLADKQRTRKEKKSEQTTEVKARRAGSRTGWQQGRLAAGKGDRSEVDPPNLSRGKNPTEDHDWPLVVDGP
jgi:hypothetical protein